MFPHLITITKYDTYVSCWCCGCCAGLIDFKSGVGKWLLKVWGRDACMKSHCDIMLAFVSMYVYTHAVLIEYVISGHSMTYNIANSLNIYCYVKNMRNTTENEPRCDNRSYLFKNTRNNHQIGITKERLSQDDNPAVRNIQWEHVIQQTIDQIRQYSTMSKSSDSRKNDLIVCIHAFYTQNYWMMKCHMLNSAKDDVRLRNTLQVFDSYKNTTISMWVSVSKYRNDIKL